MVFNITSKNKLTFTALRKAVFSDVVSDRHSLRIAGLMHVEFDEAANEVGMAARARARTVRDVKIIFLKLG